ncbi:MAG: response regulator transcription factor [Planctomycetes bacterium]|nr:response regulator transcription factor [Planctomycetota bacterium]
MKVLLVDDDPELCSVIQNGLQEESIHCTLVESGEKALELLRSKARPFFDAMLVDLDLPGASGWDVLTALRENGEEAPILFLADAERVEERVRALRLGADDYVSKSVQIEELAARIQAAVRARQSLPSLLLEDLRLDLALRRAFRGGKSIYLSPKEFDLLLVLVRAKGRLILRSEILETVWDLPSDPGTNLLDVHIGRLRKKLGRHGPDLIQTERGRGYRLGSQSHS